MTFSIRTGDVRVLLNDIASESVRTCITSPPYFGLRDYGHPDQIGLEDSVDDYVKTLVSVLNDVRRTLTEDGTLWLNLGDSYAGSWGAQSRPDGNDVGSTLKGGSMLSARQIANHPKRAQTGSRERTALKPKNLIGIPWRVAFALQDDGWILRQDIIWAKPNPMPESVKDRCTKSHEYLFLFAKSKRYHCDMSAIAEPVADATVARLAQDVEAQVGSDRIPGKTNGTAKAMPPSYRGSRFDTGKTADHQLQRMSRQPRFGGEKYGDSDDPHFQTASGNEYEPNGLRNKRDVWTIATTPFKGAHFAVMPEALVEPCILAGSEEGDTVLDPFAGSGTVGVVALRHQRNFVGIELNPEYAEMARRRIADSAPLLNQEAA